MHWAGGHLRVNISLLQQSGEPFDVLQAAHIRVMHVWRFKKLSEGRWTSVSSSARSLCAALALGLDSVVGFVRGLPAESDYYLHGYSRFSDSLRRACGVICVAGWVSDQLVEAVMEDDRVCLRAGELHETMLGELRFVGRISFDHFQRLATCVSPETDASSLRADCLQAAWVAASFFWRQVLSEAWRPPWSLAQGDIGLNLQHLASPNSIPENVTAAKNQQLARLGWRPLVLQEALQLLGHLSWSTLSVEQGHSSATLLHRQHAEYSEAVLLARSWLHACRNLLPDEAEQKKRQREDDRMSRLFRKVPRRAVGQSMLFK